MGLCANTVSKKQINKKQIDKDCVRKVSCAYIVILFLLIVRNGGNESDNSKENEQFGND